MRSFLRTIFAMALVLFWVPITSHCLLESTGGLPSFLACAEECPTNSAKGTDEDFCQNIESASYKVTNERLEVIVQVVPTLVADLLESLHSLAVAQEISCPSIVAAPEDPVTWQFTSRTALPPRAPSLAS